MPFCRDLFYRFYNGGEGRAFIIPTILIHGLGGTHLSWPSGIRRIKGQYIYALDLPGHGMTNVPAYCQASQISDKLLAFMIDMGIYSANIIGFSMGGAIALTLAQSHPERIRKLALISTGQKFRHIEKLGELLKHRSQIRIARQRLTHVGFHPTTPKSTRLKIIEPLYKARNSVLYADCRVCQSFSPKIIGSKPSFPILLICGDSDALVPQSEARKLHYLLPGSQLKIIKGGGHMILHEKTEDVRQTLVEFLKG